MTAMNSLFQPFDSPMPPAVMAMLSYSSRLLLSETTSAAVNLDSSSPALDDLADASTAMTGGEGCHHYGINE